MAGQTTPIPVPKKGIKEWAQHENTTAAVATPPDTEAAAVASRLLAHLAHRNRPAPVPRLPLRQRVSLRRRLGREVRRVDNGGVLPPLQHDRWFPLLHESSLRRMRPRRGCDWQRCCSACSDCDNGLGHPVRQAAPAKRQQATRKHSSFRSQRETDL